MSVGWVNLAACNALGLLMNEARAPRPWQFHLSTCVVLMIVIGVLLGVECQEKVEQPIGITSGLGTTWYGTRWYGWPLPYYFEHWQGTSSRQDVKPKVLQVSLAGGEVCVLGALVDASLIALFLLGVICSCEWFTRRTGPRLDTRPGRGRVPSMITAHGLSNLNNCNDNAAPRR